MKHDILDAMSLGIIIVLIVTFGYFSNWLNWRFLDHKVTRLLYYVGALVHESSHAILCLLTGAKIHEFSVFSSQPHVTYGKPKIPILGNVLISSAPIFGGLLFLFLINHYALSGRFIISSSSNWKDMLIEPFKLLEQMRPWQWQSWVMVALFINIGAMIGPSTQDMKNVWPVLIILFFIQSSFFSSIGLMALCLIAVGIMIQLIFILCLQIFGRVLE